jgi:four helix bundle protein
MFSYENLEVYKKAFQNNKVIYRFLKENKTVPAFMRDQLGRASLSIPLNIAEGSGKFGHKDRRSYYITARASCFECAAIVTFLNEENDMTDETFKAVVHAFEEISKMLYSMIKNLEVE